ncbi:alpha-protein kinase 1 isoform X2 [Echeneis naucrates]|uniref:alpha-protein kinase 1 isoform X2 n=1 Tax=Echeneis naucrates TaxID=173247 RepID=UPI001113F953|nr:alpha-protein kinase 1 isoform X2 [Echeneis naucrates]
MDSQEVGGLLEDCLRAAAAAAQHSVQPSEADTLIHCSSRDSLCAELSTLLGEAMEMKWPFVPEKWQYKLSVSANDKTNLSDLISNHLPHLLAVLKAAIVAHEARTALAVVFIVDRFLYWKDESRRLLKITKLLHRCHPDAPVAPQLVIRLARVYLNSGKLQSAEYILSRLINNSGATGCWEYRSESDRALVQAVSIQVRGMILQKLGLWLEAAELIWASLVGYFSLPQPDKKGIGTSLGILANILLSMNDEDFHAFRTNPHIEMSLLGDGSHRLLSAAQAAKMAVVYSQYTSLYVLTNVATQGTCLLSYSFSLECPDSQRQSFLLQAREAFAIGLLTKTEGEQVSSKQELHTFIKAAYSLTVTHKWLGAPQEVVVQATQACQTALAKFYDYCHADNQEKDDLCAEIMLLVCQIKHLWQVEPFINSDVGSYIPESYRNIRDASLHFTAEGFSKVMQRFQKYHTSLCETISSNCKGTKDKINGARLCITALGTTVAALTTECSTEASSLSKGVHKEEEPQQKGSTSSAQHPAQIPEPFTTLGSEDDLGSSWQKLSLSNSGTSPSISGYAGNAAIEGGAVAKNESCMTTDFDDEKSETGRNQKVDAVSSITLPRSAISDTSSSYVSSNSEKFDIIQAGIENLETEQDWITEAADMAHTPSVAGGVPKSLSHRTLRISSSSLSSSAGSQSSWEKMSLADLNSPTDRKPEPSNLLKAKTSESNKSPESDRSFIMLDCDCATSDSAQSPIPKKQPPRQDTAASSQPQPALDLNSLANMGPEMKSSLGMSCTDPPQCTSTESSFEMLEEKNPEIVNGLQGKNPLCYTCLKHSITDGAVPRQQYSLSKKDYQSLLAGICHECLMKRLCSDKTQFKLKEHRTVYSALHLKFSKASGLWTARETCVYIGEPTGMEGKQRAAIWVQFLHQEERLSSYVGKDYLMPKEIQFHLKDVERQMTAQYYVTEFNKRLYDKDVMAQIFFIPSEALLILNGNKIVGCVTVEPYMLGDFVKLTNNKEKKNNSIQATEYGIAFGHFTYLFSNGQEVVVDLQGWVTANGKGLTYLTDPQIHSTKIPQGPSNFAARGLRYFLEEQHGPDCNGICQVLKLPPVVRQTHAVS